MENGWEVVLHSLILRPSPGGPYHGVGVNTEHGSIYLLSTIYIMATIYVHEDI